MMIRAVLLILALANIISIKLDFSRSGAILTLFEMRLSLVNDFFVNEKSSAEKSLTKISLTKINLKYDFNYSQINSSSIVEVLF